MKKSFILFPYQQKAVEKHLRVLDSCGSSFDGTGCGGGKTVIAAATAARYALPVGVICPKSVIAKWEDTLAAFGVQPLFVLNPEKLRMGNTPWVQRVKGAKRKFTWTAPQGTLLIFDEAHVFGAYNSLNGALLEAAVGRPTLMLSATAAESPLKMKALGQHLRLFGPGGFWKWVKQMGATDGLWGGLEWDYSLPKNRLTMAKLHDSIFANRGYRVPEEELREQLPELMVSDEPLVLSPADRKKIKELYDGMADKDDPGGVKNLRQRQSIELVKVPLLCERASELVESGGSVVLFLNFHESIDEAARLLDTDAILDGRRTQKARAQTQADFQSGRARVVIVQIAAGGQSIDLHDTSGDRPRIALLCPQFSGLVEEQAVGRIARVGAKSRALALRLFVPHSVEEGALGITAAKRESVDLLNRGESLNVPTGADVSSPMPKVITPQPEREHSEHSPSSLKEKAKCPGFRNDESRDTTFADRGTLGHKAVETANLDIIPPDDYKLRDAAAMCLRYIEHVNKNISGLKKELRERRYKMLDQFGHIDHIILHGAEAELIDYKFAWGEYVADSPQFWAYAVGLWDAHPEVEAINVHVILPFQRVIDVETWVRAEHYDLLSAKVLAIIEGARRDDPSTYQTGAHCAWCAKKASCPKLNSLALTIATEYKADELQLPPQFDPALIDDPNIMALAKKAAPIMRSWADKVDERALAMRLQEGIEIPGFELAERNLPFKITDAQMAWEVVKDKITPEAFAACAEVRIGELEKAIARVAIRGEKGRSAEALRDALIDANAAKSEGTYHYLKKCKS